MAAFETIEVHQHDGAPPVVRVERIDDADCPSDVGLREALSLRSVTSPLRGIAAEVHDAIPAIEPDVAKIEFRRELGVKGSQLLSILLGASAKAAIRALLERRDPDSAPDRSDAS